MDTSPFLQGAFAPIYGEHTYFSGQLSVAGHLPAALDGLFTQIGPNPLMPPKARSTARYPWFSQDGMVCGIRLRDGGAEWFRNRWIRSKHVARALGERPPPGPRHFPVDTVNTNLICHGGVLLALVETGCLPARLNIDLDTIAYTDLSGGLPRGFSAHPKIDPVTGELITFAVGPLHTTGDYIVLRPDGTVRIHRRIPLHGRPMLHDIALTRKYVVLLDFSVRFHIPSAASGRFPYRFDHTHQARIGLLPREENTEPRWYDVHPGFAFHLVDAYERDGHIRIRAIRYNRIFDTPTRSPFSEGGVLWEWDIDLAIGRVEEAPLDDRPQELPRTDPRTIAKHSRHHYAIAARTSAGVISPEPGALIKHDAYTGVTAVRSFPPGLAPAEPVFVPRGEDEDDGWILHLLYNAADDTSSLVVLDALNFTGEPVATISVPMRVPFGFHSSWITATDLAAVVRGTQTVNRQ